MLDKWFEELAKRRYNICNNFPKVLDNVFK